MFSGLNQLINLNFTFHKPSSVAGDIWYAAAPIALLMFASFVYSISSKNKNDMNVATYPHVSPEIADVPVAVATAAPCQLSDDDVISWKSAGDVLFQEDNDENIMLETDAKYAEEIQIQEALLASMFASQNNASTSSHNSLRSLLKNNNDIESQIMCKICFENQEAWQMFKNSTCSHSFCYECIRKHANVQIRQGKKKDITCPELNCNSTLDFHNVRLIIPQETLVKWDELLCESTIHESHKLYCPFSNCSVLLINDDISITRIDCPVCRRAFCAVCRVPWHSEFTCKEFEKLNGKKKGTKGDDMAVALAKKKKWKKCPKCKFFVEKTEGCVHITCRCKYEFCYTCGAKWSSTHGGCKPRS